MSKKRAINFGLEERNYGKTDIDRVGNMHIKSNDKIAYVCFQDFFTKSFSGFFSDPPAGPFDVYREQPVKFREDIAKARQILGAPPNQLFEKKYERIFEGEALREPWRDVAKQRVYIYNMRNYGKSILDHLLKIKR